MTPIVECKDMNDIMQDLTIVGDIESTDETSPLQKLDKILHKFYIRNHFMLSAF